MAATTAPAPYQDAAYEPRVSKTMNEAFGTRKKSGSRTLTSKGPRLELGLTGTKAAPQKAKRSLPTVSLTSQSQATAASESDEAAGARKRFSQPPVPTTVKGAAQIPGLSHGQTLPPSGASGRLTSTHENCAVVSAPRPSFVVGLRKCFTLFRSDVLLALWYWMDRVMPPQNDAHAPDALSTSWQAGVRLLLAALRQRATLQIKLYCAHIRQPLASDIRNASVFREMSFGGPSTVAANIRLLTLTARNFLLLQSTWTAKIATDLSLFALEASIALALALIKPCFRLVGGFTFEILQLILGNMFLAALAATIGAVGRTLHRHEHRLQRLNCFVPAVLPSWIATLVDYAVSAAQVTLRKARDFPSF